MCLPNVVNKNHCEPPLQAIESKGELASNSLKLSLFTKGLRRFGLVESVTCIKFKTFPVSEGITLRLRSGNDATKQTNLSNLTP